MSTNPVVVVVESFSVLCDQVLCGARAHGDAMLPAIVTTCKTMPAALAAKEIHQAGHLAIERNGR